MLKLKFPVVIVRTFFSRFRQMKLTVFLGFTLKALAVRLQLLCFQSFGCRAGFASKALATGLAFLSVLWLQGYLYFKNCGCKACRALADGARFARTLLA